MKKQYKRPRWLSCSLGCLSLIAAGYIMLNIIFLVFGPEWIGGPSCNPEMKSELAALTRDHGYKINFSRGKESLVMDADGSNIHSYSAPNLEKYNQIHSPDGSNATRLWPNTEVTFDDKTKIYVKYHVWSLDSKQIAFTNSSKIYVMYADETLRRKIYDSGAITAQFVGKLDWSPDSRYIAFRLYRMISRNESKTDMDATISNIYVVRVDGTSACPVTTDDQDVPNDNPVWVIDNQP